MNKTIKGILEKVNEGKALTEKQQKIYTSFITDMGGERVTIETAQEAAQEVTQEANGLEDLINETAQETAENTTQEADTMTTKKLDLNTLTEIENSYATLSKHNKLKEAKNSNLDLFGQLQELGIYGIFNGKKALNDIGTHYIGYALPELEGMDYREAYKKLSTLYRKNPNFKKTLEENAQGEIITIAGYGGNFLNFIKPYGENKITLEGQDGTEITIDKGNWSKQPLAIWANGGRMIKVFYTLGMVNYLKGNYYQKPSDKFQLSDLTIRNKHWLHFEKRGEKIGLITKNGNFKEIPKDLQSGWEPIITWTQNNVM
jgi:hypothetical protein